MYKLFLASLFLILMIGCEDHENIENVTFNSPEDQIIGKWEWIRTTGGLAGVDETPLSTGKTLQINFESNGAFVWGPLEDASITGMYYLDTVMTIFSSIPLPVINLDSNLIFEYKFWGNDSLDLSENYYDGFNYSFVRD